MTLNALASLEIDESQSIDGQRKCVEITYA